ncbi:MAG TPA: site-2 protease family protein [Candidatus Paceibacterota bacterium]|nr:site-2 protease family protein [Candidatus Paceibacterota bacterium]
MDAATAIFVVVIIVFSSIIHEVMHGTMADLLGDKTARYAGRLTLNPIPHIDLFGSILLPLTLVLTGSPIFFGYAKPVPYNPYNLRPGRFSEAFVAGAGPLSNLVLALIGGFVIRSNVFAGANDVIFLIVVVNTMLFLFNLIPIPPLDGSKVFESILPRGIGVSYARLRRSLDSNPLFGMLLVVVLILFLGNIWANIVYGIASGIAGI